MEWIEIVRGTSLSKSAWFKKGSGTVVRSTLRAVPATVPDPFLNHASKSREQMAKRSAYQERAIKNYYKNRDAIMLQRLGELVTDLYLAEGKSRARVWQRVSVALEKLEIPPRRIEHLVQSDNPELVANLLKELMSGA